MALWLTSNDYLQELVLKNIVWIGTGLVWQQIFCFEFGNTKHFSRTQLIELI